VRILFVDNHPEFTAVVVGAFLVAHEVVIVPTIAAARAAIGGSDFDVALVDYDLDDGKGVEFVRWVRAANSKLPLIAVSARAEGNDALVAAGTDRVCAKTDFARIGAVLDELVRARP
jgi:DNA-binding response OmpR family regulator